MFNIIFEWIIFFLFWNKFYNGGDQFKIEKKKIKPKKKQK